MASGSFQYPGGDVRAAHDHLARFARRRGRKVYFGLTDRATEVLPDTRRRVWETGAINRSWNGRWTLVGFSLPDTRRHDLRSHLLWAGFGMLQNGLWIAPGARDAEGIVERLGLADHVTVFTARPGGPTGSADLVHRMFDTAAIAARYRALTARWDVADPLPACSCCTRTGSSWSTRTRTCPPSTWTRTGPPSAPNTSSTPSTPATATPPPPSPPT